MSNDLQIKEQAPLAPYTTWKIGGLARWLIEARSTQEIMDSVRLAKHKGWNLRVIGNGSNTLVSDQGFDGLVIVTRNDQLVWQPPTVVAGAGVKLGQLIANALQQGCGGLYFLLGVPGSLGGSLYGNAGSREQAIGQYVEWVDGVTADGQSIRWTQAECQFAYRTSRFKHEPVTIVQAALNIPLVDTSSERQRLAEKAAWKNRAQPTTASSAGCMFKNPQVETMELPEDLRPLVFPDGTISAWRLIKAVDLQGRQLGKMQISPLHANFLLNLGGGTSDQAVQLISLVKQQVRDKLGVQLQEEIQYLGF